jgi:hypothetical protein
MNLIEQLQSEFRTLTTSREARRAVDRLAANHPCLNAMRTSADIAQSLKQRDSVKQTAILNSLIAASPDEPLAARIILEAFLPTVMHCCTRVRLNNDNRDDFASEMITAVYEAVRTLATQPADPYPATKICRFVDNATKRWQRNEPKAPEPIGDINDLTEGEILSSAASSDDTTRNTDRVLVALVEAIHHGLVTKADGNFVARALLNGDNTQTEAERTYYDRRTIQKRLQRTVTVLAEQLAPAA